MKKKTIVIDVPEGYTAEYDKQTHQVVFKRTVFQPKSWEEFCKDRWEMLGSREHTFYYIANSEILSTVTPGNECESIMSTKQEAEAFLALMKLRQLREAWIGDWKRVDKELDYVAITYNATDGTGVHRSVYSHPLTFPNVEQAAIFYNCFKDLIDVAAPLL